MPIRIYITDSQETLTILSNDIWDLPSQLNELEIWLSNEGYKLTKGKYVADIGFKARANYSGGGGILSTNTIDLISRIGLEIYFSEY